jgi:C-terminal processing protease CtpA/Prc
MVGLSRLASPLALALLIAAPLVAQDETAVPLELSDAEKLYGLSLLWQEANYNFAFFDQVPDLDWDGAYLEFIPRVLASESTYDYYRELRRFIALLEDGHTGVNYPQALGNRESYPWILVRNVEDRAVVVNVGRGLEAEIPVNSIIEMVDGVPASDYAAAYQLPYVFSSTPHHRWDEALRWVLRGPAAESIRITYVTLNGERRERQVDRDRRTREDEWLLPTSSTRDRFELRWLDEGIAYVALNTFNDTAVVSDFEAALPELYRARALVIDVRQNGGGSSNNGYRIAAYLTDDTLQTSRWRTRQNIAAYKAWGRQDYVELNSWFDGGTHGDVPPAEVRRLVVPTVVLQEHATFSAAEDFLVAIDAIPHITTVGRPSGGSTGQPLMFELPGGGWAAICSKRDTYPDGRDFVGIGVQPDVVVEPTLDAVLAGRDRALETAVELLRESLGPR